MRMHRAWPSAVVLALGLAGCSTGAEIPADVRAALAKADSWELYSLDPEQRKDLASAMICMIALSKWSFVKAVGAVRYCSVPWEWAMAALPA